MNLFRSLSEVNKVRLNRVNTVLKYGSPKYHYDVAALAAGAVAHVSVATQWTRAKKYEPLDSVIVINNDVVDISLLINGTDLYIVPAASIRQISRDELGAIWHFRVTNLDTAAAITVDKVDIELWKAPADADSVARGL